MLETFPTKNLVEVEKSYNGKLSTSCTSTVLLHSGTFSKCSNLTSKCLQFSSNLTQFKIFPLFQKVSRVSKSKQTNQQTL